jgi:hypothetical protein
LRRRFVDGFSAVFITGAYNTRFSKSWTLTPTAVNFES